MKKLLLLLAVISCLSFGTVAQDSGEDGAFRDGYPYIAFEKTDGTKTFVPSSSLIITTSGSTLTAGDYTFNLAELNKMYFSATVGIEDYEMSDPSQFVIDDSSEIYDLLGRRVKIDKMHKGVYVVKTGNVVRKISMQ